MKVFIVDDDPIYRYSFSKVLKKIKADLEVILANDGEEALDLFHSAYQANTEKILVLLDLNMPVMDGWEFLKKVSQLDLDLNRVAVYIVSSSSNPTDLDRSEDFSIVSGYLIKPLKREVLLEVLTAN